MINTVHGLTKLIKYFIGEEKTTRKFKKQCLKNCFRNKQIVLLGGLLRKIAKLFPCIVKPYAHVFSLLPAVLQIQGTYPAFPSISILPLTSY